MELIEVFDFRQFKLKFKDILDNFTSFLNRPNSQLFQTHDSNFSP